MSKTAPLLIATVAVITLLVTAAYGWYSFTGWREFAYETGANPSWMPTGGDVSRLRFKDCVFTVRRGDGVAATKKVTANLNAMAVGLRGGANLPPALTLDRPLNPFSFTINGFNDPESAPDPSKAPWCTSPCAVGGCANCPGGPAVTLTGKVRTI